MSRDVEGTDGGDRGTPGLRSKRDFRFNGVRLCFAFTGTCGDRRAPKSYERLNAPSDFVRWCREAGLTRSPIEVGPGDLTRTLVLREAIQRVGESLVLDVRPARVDVEAINSSASSASLVPELSSDARTVKWAPSTVDQVLSTLARDAIDAFAQPGNGSIKVCDAPRCGGLFTDTSRAQRRRWCSMTTCGDQAKKLTYRGSRRSD